MRGEIRDGFSFWILKNYIDIDRKNRIITGTGGHIINFKKKKNTPERKKKKKKKKPGGWFIFSKLTKNPPRPRDYNKLFTKD